MCLFFLIGTAMPFRLEFISDAFEAKAEVEDGLIDKGFKINYYQEKCT